jgi:predicted ribosome quality control (RQC) complex YloA/Tae2 family protein
MQKRIMVCVALSALVVSCLMARVQAKAQTQSQNKQDTSAQSTATDAKEKNIQEYIELMRSNVRDEKAEIMGAVMQLSIDDAAKFWPIYSEYDAELSKLNNLRVANIEDYARNYSQMTDEKADELIQRSLDYQKQRGELLAKYYQIMKQSLGAVTAARFLQVEHQLLLIIDLQIASSLPIVQE